MTLYYEMLDGRERARGSSSRTIKTKFLLSIADRPAKATRENRRKKSQEIEIKTKTIRSNDKKV